MTTAIGPATPVTQTSEAPPEKNSKQPTAREAAITSISKKYLSGQISMTEMLLGVGEKSHDAHNETLRRLTEKVERLADSTREANNLATLIEDAKNISWPADETSEEATNKRRLLISIVSDAADFIGVEVPPKLKEIVSAMEKDPKADCVLNADRLKELKKVCSSIGQQAGKIEQQEQLKINQKQLDHNNLMKFLINLMDSIQKIIDHIIQKMSSR